MTTRHYTDGSDWLDREANEMTVRERQETIQQLRQLKVERDELMLQNKELRDCLSRLVKDIDAWEAIVATREGRVPNATWGNLDEARRLISRT